MMAMTPLHIIGQPGAGKTTLMADLIQALAEGGLAVGSLKHSSHAHELDKPGKDSFIHREAGAVPAAMVTGKMAAVYLPKGAQAHPGRLLERYFQDTDITLIEGWISGPHVKVEVWRAETRREPLFLDLPETARVRALVTDDPLSPAVLEQARARHLVLLSRQDRAAIVQWIFNWQSHRRQRSAISLKETVFGMNFTGLMKGLARRKQH